MQLKLRGVLIEVDAAQEVGRNKTLLQEAVLFTKAEGGNISSGDVPPDYYRLKAWGARVEKLHLAEYRGKRVEVTCYLNGRKQERNEVYYENQLSVVHVVPIG